MQVDAELEMATYEWLRRGNAKRAAKAVERIAREMDAYVDDIAPAEANGKAAVDIFTIMGSRTIITAGECGYNLRIRTHSRYIEPDKVKTAVRVLQKQMEEMLYNLRDGDIERVKCTAGSFVSPPLGPRQQEIFCEIDARADSVEEAIRMHELSDAWMSLAEKEVQRAIAERAGQQ